MSAIRSDGTCIRCGEKFGTRFDERCQECGVHITRTIVRNRRRSKIGGKRGRNSGKVSQHGKKN